MTDYKSTLNLPTTTFPMKANLAQREPSILAMWQTDAIYKKIREARMGCERFILHDGPPYANGHLHCGHALNKILKDIIVKSKTMEGYDAPFVPGWDCHGLPIELNVEKKLGRVGIEISAKEFRRECRKYAESQIDIQRDEFQRLGVFGDWYHPYVTMDYTYEANILRALGKILNRGHLYQGLKPVHWCIECGSALAEAEVEYEEKKSHSIDVAFYAVNPQQFLKKLNVTLPEKPVIVPIWTTTPWTLPANEAVCLHPKLNYALIDLDEYYMLVASDLLSSTLERYQSTSSKVIIEVQGSILEHELLKHPLYDRQVPIVLGEHVTTEAGTGCVHTAPAHGPDDYQIGLTYQLPLKNPVLANGRYAEDVPLFAGMLVLKSNPAIIEKLQDNQVLLHQTLLQHSYPHCWRHKSPMIFRATPQWFISMQHDQLRQGLLQAIEQVSWIPEWGKARIANMIKNRPDWCISRQRSWGTPIPFFIHKTTKELHPDTQNLIEQVAKRVEKSGIDGWFNLDIQEFLGPDAEFYEQSQDTLDVWFDAGVSHFCVLQAQSERLGFPADIYFEGSDQHRGWFNSSLTTSVIMNDVPPYKMVLTHGYTVDAEGHKLSKSRGNYVELDKLIQQHGADVLRLWVASTDYRNEVSISDEIMKRTADAYRRIRNTARFLLANLFDFDPNKDCLTENFVELDAWALERCRQLQVEILEAYQQFNFHIIYQKIHNFCAVDMGSFYLDIIKDRQYTTPMNSHARRSCQTAMYHIIHALTRWLAPILSFTADEIWQAFPGKQEESVFVETWYQGWPLIKSVDMEYWETIQKVRDEVNKALEAKRQAGEFGSGLSAEVTIYAHEQVLPQLMKLEDELRFVLITSKAKVLPLEMSPPDITVNPELTISVEVKSCESPKCARCWHRLESVGINVDHPELCQRCVDNISGSDEVRRFA